ncbi:MAG TPA: helix-turn-helix domain-containing protein, partial [Deltaproteobacteria bacterium]|nr:helix-turn-helix domain-containing protein [Deltaproteobacteria bacterium]
MTQGDRMSHRKRTPKLDKSKVRTVAKETIKKKKKERKEEQTKRFSQYYNRLKKFTFPRREEVNVEKHIYLPKRIAMVGLSKRALSVYPALCSRADFEKDKWFQVPQSTIATLSGLNVNTVKKATEELRRSGVKFDRKTPLLKMKKVSEGKRHFYIYRIGFIRKGLMKDWKEQFFIFHTCIIDSGVWAELTPRAKVLYLGLRGLAFFDVEIYAEIEFDCSPGDLIHDGFMEDIGGEEYRNRLWDVCTVSPSKVCRLVGIDGTDLQTSILPQLESVKLA